MKKPPPAPKDLVTRGTLLCAGKVRLTKRLAAGGNGVVWLAEHLSIGQTVVAKFPISNGENEAQQIQTEIQLLAKYSNSHPNIVNILDVGIYKQRTFIITQWMENGSLGEYLLRSRSNVEQSGNQLRTNGDWVLTIAQALDFLHVNDMLHLDVKPANILFDSSYSPYLSDFGIAKSQAHAGTSCNDGFVFGSMPYMAPEMLSGNPCAQSDQFALAVTIWEFLMGRRPFQASESVKHLELVKASSPDSNPRARVDSKLTAVLKRGLSFDADNRFGKCSEFASAVIRHWDNGQASWPPSKASRQTEAPTDALNEKSTKSIYHSESETDKASEISTENTDSNGNNAETNSGVEDNVKKRVKLSRILRRPKTDS